MIDAHPYALFHAAAAAWPGKVAVDDGERALAYAQLADAATALAERIAATVPPGGLVAILVPVDARFPVALLACLRAGRGIAAIDPNYPDDYIAASLAVAGPAAIITAPGTVLDGAATRLPRIDLPAPDPSSLAMELPPEPTLPPVDRDSVGLVMFTSGSTGLPKGVALPPTTLPRGAWWLGKYVNVGPADRVLSLQSFCTSPGLTDTYTALVSGATLHLSPLRSQGLAAAERVLRHGAITVVSLAPSVLRALLRLPDAKGTFAATRLVRIAGEPVLDLDVKAAREILPAGAELLVDFGATEVGGVLARIIPPDEAMEVGTVPLGRPHEDLVVSLEDADGQEVPTGEEGLLTVRGRAICFGYWNDGAIDNAGFPADPGRSGGRIMRTGDLCRARPDGVICIIGRADRQVKINGIRVEPAQTESVLRAQADVEDAAVLARQMPNGPVLVGFVAPKPGAALDPSDISAALARLLPAVQSPTRLHVMAEIPRLAGFKIDQTALLAHDDAALAARPAAPAAAPGADDEDPAMRSVIAAWRNVLGHRPSRPHIAFGDDGGDSLGLLQVLFRVEHDLGRRLRPDVFDLDMNPAALVQAIARHGDNTVPDGLSVLLLPGVGGAGPTVARFRGACAPELAMEVLEYGDWREWLSHGPGVLPLLLDRLEAEILARVPEGTICLAGYSLGGLLAYLLAQRLRARGRDIGFLGLLDAGADTGIDGGPPQRKWHAEFARLWQPVSRGGGQPGRAVTVSRVLALRPMAPLLRLLARHRTTGAAEGFPLMVHHNLNMMVLIRLSTEWRRTVGDLGRLDDVPVTLFRCRQRQLPNESPDLGWHAHCADLRVIDVGGDHASMLQPPHLDGLRAAFVSAAINASVSGRLPAA